MDTQGKSSALAKVMGWDLSTYGTKLPEHMREERIQVAPFDDMVLDPYSTEPNGLAQFAAISLKFPEVLNMYSCKVTNNPRSPIWKDGNKPTQENMLDEILKMNGIKI